MTRKYFGTDGIRGRVGEAPITPDFVLRLGYAAGQVLSRADVAPPHRDRPAVLIGKDTRISGYMLEAALESGLSAAGVDTLLVGPMPTPGVAFLTRALRLSAGIMVSASHNPFEDNGIKFFSAEGAKLPDAVEHEIEAVLAEPLVTRDSAHLGKAERVHDAEGRYIEFCKGTFAKHRTLRGLKLVVDCAHGACYRWARACSRSSGPRWSPSARTPTASTSTTATARRTPRRSRGRWWSTAPISASPSTATATASRWPTTTARLFDGDQLLYAIAKHRHEIGRLRGGVAGTLMTNFALERRFAEMGIPFERARVGDRYVLEMLNDKGWECGGENSGHILCLDCHSTGDAIISALQVLEALVAAGQTLGDFTRELTLLPQVLVNVRLDRGVDALSDARVREAVASRREGSSTGGAACCFALRAPSP